MVGNCSESAPVTAQVSENSEPATGGPLGLIDIAAVEGDYNIAITSTSNKHVLAIDLHIAIPQVKIFGDYIIIYACSLGYNIIAIYT